MQISSGDFKATIAVGSGFFVMGTAIGLPAFFQFRRSYRQARHWKTASATILGCKVHAASPDAMPVSVQEFQFVTDTGEVVIGFADVGSRGQCFRVGASIKILYPPEDPTKARLKTFDALWAAPIFLGFFAAAFLGISVFLVIHLIMAGLGK
jgi:hypothetical protein